MKGLCQIILLACILPFSAAAQNLPSEFRLLADQHQINLGGDTEQGLYKQDEMKTIYLEFSQSNWWNQLTTNYNSGADLSATMTIDGVTYEQVGVGFKGQTSYMMVNGEEKKSFSIKTDAFIDGQTCQGYKTFNLNNCFDDPSFLREFLYLHMICNHIPAAKAAFVKLVINGENWGVYPSVQQMNGDYLKEWFMSNDGALWRADSPTSGFGGGGGGGGGPQWGDGTAALNYLGPDTLDYQEYYTLKSTGIENPWDQLVNTCDVLENTALANLITDLPPVMDVDRALWLLACEIAFGDDDGYIFKGKMDYYLYWESETGRMTPLEYDGNSVLVDESENWAAFYHADNANYPLMNLLMQVPDYRQRYLAHLRTIMNELMDDQYVSDMIDFYYNLIDAEVQLDDKKLYSYTQFTQGPNDLTSRIAARKTLLSNNTEVNTVGAAISNVVMESAAGEWGIPLENELVDILAQIESGDGIFAVNLYYSADIVGNFTQLTMLDDGNNNDGSAGDGVYGMSIPGQAMGTLVRFYIEAIENNNAKTRTYLPVGAEHDVFYYQITAQFASATDIVINEIMASNDVTASDELGEFDDWIELYNKGNNTVDLSGWHLTDNAQNLDKWAIPDGTTLSPDQYLIIWADEDSSQGPMHANFKLSASGEMVTLINNETLIANQIAFEQQQTDLGYARSPNGIGDFVIQVPTFASNNDVVEVEEVMSTNAIHIYPNPASDFAFVKLKNNIGKLSISILDTQGRLIHQHPDSTSSNTIQLETSTLISGVYTVVIQTENAVNTAKLIIQR
ncbi:MAG: CotH kinase family protein [Flavobacteriales bacterium]